MWPVGLVCAGVAAETCGETLSELADGSRDATATIQGMLDETGKRGGGVELPAGQFRIDGSLRVPSGVTLRGRWTSPHHGMYTLGTTLLVYGGRGDEKQPAAVELSASSAAKGLTFVWPEQRIEDVKPYPWAIHGVGMHGTVENITFVNAYKGIAFGPEVHELSNVRQVYGCVLRMGVLIDNCWDISRVENVHFNPHYWLRSGHPSRPQGGKGKKHPGMQVAEYMNQNLEAFVFGKSDWQYCFNTFVFASKVGYKFIRTGSGACNGQFVGIGADATQCGIYVEESQPIAIHVTNGQFAPFWGPNPKGVYTGPKFKGSLQLSTCSFWGPMDQVAILDGPGWVSFEQCQFLHWDHSQKGLPAITANAGKLMVTGCQFTKKGPDIKLGEKVRFAIIHSNLAGDGLDVANGIGDRAISPQNE